MHNKYSEFILFFFLAGFLNGIYGMSINNVSDFNFGLVRPGYFPVKESTVWVKATHYTLVIHGQYDKEQSFNMANGIYKVSYAISWKDNGGNYAPILPNTISPIFTGNDSEKGVPAILQMQIKGDFPKPGHYSDTLTLIITPA